MMISYRKTGNFNALYLSKYAKPIYLLKYKNIELECRVETIQVYFLLQNNIYLLKKGRVSIIIYRQVVSKVI